MFCSVILFSCNIFYTRNNFDSTDTFSVSLKMQWLKIFLVPFAWCSVQASRYMLSRTIGILVPFPILLLGRFFSFFFVGSQEITYKKNCSGILNFYSFSELNGRVYEMLLWSAKKEFNMWMLIGCRCEFQYVLYSSTCSSYLTLFLSASYFVQFFTTMLYEIVLDH